MEKVIIVSKLEYSKRCISSLMDTLNDESKDKNSKLLNHYLMCHLSECAVCLSLEAVNEGCCINPEDRFNTLFSAAFESVKAVKDEIAKIEHNP